MKKYKIKVQEIDGDKKKTVMEETCDGFVCLVDKGNNVGGEMGANISDARIGDIMLSSPHMMEIHNMITAHVIAKSLGVFKDPEDDLADKIGGTLQ